MKWPNILLAGTLVIPVTTIAPPKLGLPPLPTYPATEVALGKAIFFSPYASADGKVSCSSCHLPEHAFSDGQAVAIGTYGRVGSRNSPALTNAAFSTPLMWDGRRATLDQQVLHPFNTAREHGLLNIDAVIKGLESDPAVIAAHPSRLSEKDVQKALTAYVTSLAHGNSAFDRLNFAGQNNALTPEQKAGLTLFKQAGCTSCHLIQKTFATFTDNQMHVSSQALVIPDVELNKRLELANNVQPNDLDKAITENPDLAVLGRYLVTHNKRDIGAIKTPSLRDVAKSAPYFHDGSITTLDAAIRQELSYRSIQSGKPTILDDQEIKSIVQFLEALNSQ